MKDEGKRPDFFIGAGVALVAVVAVAGLLFLDFYFSFIFPETAAAWTMVHAKGPVLLVATALFFCFVMGSIAYTVWWWHRLKHGKKSKET